MKILLFLAGLAAAVRLPKERVVYAVNCGAPRALRSADGFVYAPDAKYSPQSEISIWEKALDGSAEPVKYTDDPQLYATERWGKQSFSYSLPVREEGRYVIITQHAENAFQSGGRRVWDHYIGKTRVEAGVDAAAVAGHRGSIGKYYEVELREGQVFFRGQPCPEAYLNGEIVFTFGHLGRDNPLVNGIVVVRGGLQDTDFPRLAALRQEYDRRYAKEGLKRVFEEKYAGMMAPGKTRKPRRNDFAQFFAEESVLVEEETRRWPKAPLVAILLAVLLALGVHLLMSFLAEARQATTTAAQTKSAAEPPRARGRKSKRE